MSASPETGVRPEVRGITVLFDPDCPVCRASRSWMQLRRPLVRVQFVPVGSEEARRRFPALDMDECRREITVVTDQGYVYRGRAAFILCLWALRSTRVLAIEMARGRRAYLLATLTGATAWFRELSLRTGCDERVPDSLLVTGRTRGEQTKAAIIDAALALFTERGFDATTMRAIAESAGVSLGNAYYYFRSKDELVQGFYDRTAVEHGERLPAVLDGVDGLADRLTAHLDLWFELMAPQHPFAVGFFRNAADPASPLSPFSAASAPARMAAIALMELVVEGVVPAVPATVRAQLPEVLWLYHMGVVLFWVHDRSAEQAATRLLVRRTAPMIERVVALADLPALQATIVDLTTLLTDLKAMAG